MDKLYLERFRLIKDPIEMDIKPITILTGQNNSGKSSIIKSLLLLSDFLEQEQQLHLEYTGRFSSKHKLFDFTNTHNWFSIDKSFTFAYETNNNKIEFSFTGDMHDPGTLKFFRLSDRTSDGIVIKKFTNEINIKADLFYFERKFESNLFNLEWNLNINFKELKNELEEKINLQMTYPVGSKDYLNTTNQINKLRDRIKTLERKMDRDIKGQRETIVNSTLELDYKDENALHNLNLPTLLRSALAKYFIDFSRNEFIHKTSANLDLLKYYDALKNVLAINIHYLGPNRTYQSRLYLSHNNSQEINEVSNEFAKNLPPKGSKAQLFLNKWLREFGIGEDIKVNCIENTASSVQVKVQGLDEYINLADKGYGAGQVTTILLKITNLINKKSIQGVRRTSKFKENKPILIIEEPEANLHPSYQSKLAELFYETFKEFGIVFILETHSEYLVRKLQVLVANNLLDPDHVGILYLDKSLNQEVTINTIRILDDGRLSDNFGKGFFDEAGNHTLELIKLKHRNTKE